MAKITYLLGAGASKDAVPLANELMAKMIELNVDIDKCLEINDYARPVKSGSPTFLVEDFNLATEYKTDLKQLSIGIGKQTSLDNYAKSLIRKKDFLNLDKLKALLSTYFAMQILFTKNETAPRYNSFWLSMTRKKDITKLTNNVRILSWNYDSQIELSYADYFNGSVHTAISHLNIYNNDSINRGKINAEQFAVYKLNGTAALHIDYGSELRAHHEIYTPKYDELLVKDTLRKILKRYAELVDYSNSKKRPSLCFAEEHEDILDPGQKPFMDYIQADIKDTEVLVTIGYSFPSTNQEVDEALLSAMPSLKKIYIQNPKAVEIYEDLKGRLILNPTTQVILINDEERLKSFYIPHEYKFCEN